MTERTLRPRWNRVKGMVSPWGTELSQNAAKYAIIDLGQAAEAWGEHRRRVKTGQRAGRRVGFPKFKRRKHEPGFRADNGPDTVRVDGKVVILPKIGRVAMVEELRFHGSIREVTVNRTAGTWFACFCIEDGQELPPVREGPTIGVDVGVGTMATCSDGAMVENPKALATALQRLRRLDKAIARSRNVDMGTSNDSNRRERVYAKRRRLPRSGDQPSERQSPQGDDGDSQVGGPRGGGDAERCRHDEEPQAGASNHRCGDVRFSGQAGVQVPVVRR